MTLHFEPISLDRQEDYLEILSRCPQIASDYTFVNREQDLNDEGLRKTKLSYHPGDYLRKFRVTLAGTFR